MKKTCIAICLTAILCFLYSATTHGIEMLSTVPLEKESQETTKFKGAQKFLNRQNEETFSLAKGLDPGKWFFVNLKPKCNLNIFSQDGKTCPVTFPYMPLGKQTFYGVPFEIIAPDTNENKTTIALPSKRLFPNSLPKSATVDVGHKAKVLYFLHVSYYTSAEGEQFYQINYEDGTSFKIPFVGKKVSGDWYHQHTRVYSENVHYVLIPAAKGSRTFHRNMHILQWKNKFPGKKIKSITCQSDPNASMGIFVVAVTGHPG